MQLEIDLPTAAHEFTRRAFVQIDVVVDSVVDIFPNLSKESLTLADWQHLSAKIPALIPIAAKPSHNAPRRALPTSKTPLRSAPDPTSTAPVKLPISPMPATVPTPSFADPLSIAARILSRVGYCNPGIDRRIILAARPQAHVGDDPVAHWHFLAVLHAMAECRLTYGTIAMALERNIIQIHASLLQARSLYSTCTFFKVACDMYASQENYQ